jgi:diketogulonate reductase-like aldo/keto reductase
MVELHQQGFCKSIGVANCHQHHLEEILKVSDVVPAINQIEVHPLFTQKPLIEYCKLKGIVVEAYTPVARCDDRLIRLPLLRNIAEKYNKKINQIILRWHIQNGVIPIVRSLNAKHQIENISIFDFELTREEIEKIDSININSRLRYDPDNCDFSIL